MMVGSSDDNQRNNNVVGVGGIVLNGIVGGSSDRDIDDLEGGRRK